MRRDDLTTWDMHGRPELVLDWEHDGEEHERYFSVKPKGPQWYVLSQWREELKEGRIVGQS